jgi:signal peptidase
MLTGKVLLLPLLAFLLAWFFLFRPVSLGGPASYVMVSGVSMEPTLHSGDLVATRKYQSYQKGDIVAFRVEGGIVIHRIVGGSAEEGFTTQGDNSETVDRWRPTGEDIVGRMWFSIPAGGDFLALLRQPLILGWLAGGLGVLTVLSGGSGKPGRSSDTSRSRPRAASLGGPPGTRVILGLVMAAALTRAIGLLRKRGRRPPG